MLELSFALFSYRRLRDQWGRVSSVQLVERNLNQLAAEVSAWANINRMALNATKTKSMLVSSPQKLNTLLSQSLNVAVNDSIRQNSELPRPKYSE